MNKEEIKLEVGMYVRTKTKGIGKIISLTWWYDDDCCLIEIAQNHRAGIRHHNIINPSYNIIDLIEEGDLLNIEYYSERYKERVTRLFEVTYKYKQFINLDNAKCQFMLTNGEWSEKDKRLNPFIKSIVTHEQYDNMKYEVK